MDSEKKKKAKTSIAVDPDLWAEFKVEAARQRLEPGAAIERLISQYLTKRYSDDKTSPAEATYTAAELHALLDEVLQDGTRHMGAIVQNLELLAFALRFVGTHSTDEIRALRKRLSEETDPKKPNGKGKKKN